MLPQMFIFYDDEMVGRQNGVLPNSIEGAIFLNNKRLLRSIFSIHVGTQYTCMQDIIHAAVPRLHFVNNRRTYQKNAKDSEFSSHNELQ